MKASELAGRRLARRTVGTRCTVGKGALGDEAAQQEGEGPGVLAGPAGQGGLDPVGQTVPGDAHRFRAGGGEFEQGRPGVGGVGVAAQQAALLEAVRATDGSTVRMEVYLFGEFAPDGRFRRIEETTLLLEGADADRNLGSAR
ncbi:hypothetical protein ABH931_005669 [Streptacidiphilus sp. MAP12-33]|uniref:hypothetical protein n=1 Tax=Streptacidiphilus sp. MAP12-33 TaxID=3156266 RepID=UPI00351934E2